MLLCYINWRGRLASFSRRSPRSFVRKRSARFISLRCYFETKNAVGENIYKIIDHIFSETYGIRDEIIKKRENALKVKKKKFPKYVFIHKIKLHV